MGLFSKETCEFCSKQAGLLGRKKITDKKYICKECEKKKRIAKGDQTEYDRRVKDTPMFKVQATKTPE